MRRTIYAAAALALLPLAACGGGQSDPNQPSAKEREQLDEAARKLDEQQDETFDTSADSLVINESASEPLANGAAPDEAPAANALAGNSAAQR